MKILKILITVLITIHVGLSHGTDLIDVWTGVSQHDPDVASALSSKLAGSEKRQQALSLWLPNINLVGTSGKMNASSEVAGANFSAPAPLGASNGVAFNTSIKDGATNAWSVQARQPLFSQERLAQSKQLGLGADAAEIEWKLANNELMIRTAQRYFDVVLLTHKLALLKSENEAIKIEAAKAKEKFNLGESPIIDAHEANAKLQELTAQLISTDSELQIARYVLSNASAIPLSNLVLMHPVSQLRAFNASSVEDWLFKAKQSNPLLKLIQTKSEIAHQEVSRLSLSASSSLDLVAQATQQKLSGNGDFGAASTNSLQQMIGIQLTIPLFTGGYTYAKQEEALKLEEKSRYELASAELKVTLSVESSWMAMASGQSRIDALSAALLATNAKLDATKLAQEVGDRTTLDLINAQNTKTLTEINLLQAKIDYLMNQLNLFALVGELDMDKLRSINAQLEM